MDSEQRTPRIRRVISGGQSGADRAGLLAAKEVGLETGGTAPRGFMTVEGKKPGLGRHFGLKELRASGRVSEMFVRRSMVNVDDADATVVFRTKASAGSDNTIRYCSSGRWGGRGPGRDDPSTPYRPCLVISNLSKGLYTQNVVEIVKFVRRHKVETLNVAGHRSDATAGVAQFADSVRSILVDAFTALTSE